MWDTKRFYHVVAVVYVVVRLINILGLPLYLDEGNYVAWANLARKSDGYAYVALQDGKTPLFIWIVAGLRGLVPDYMLAARVVSVLGGLMTLLAWSKIVKMEFGDKIARVFAIVFIIFPYGMFMERLGLVDSMTVGFSSLGLMMYLMLMKNTFEDMRWVRTLCMAGASGICWGLSYWTKSSATALMFVGVGVVTLRQILAGRGKGVIKIVVIAACVFLVFKEMVATLRVGGYRFWANIAKKENELTFSPKQVMDMLKIRDFGLYKRNIIVSRDYLVVYVGLLGVFAVIGAHKKAWLGIYCVIITGGILAAARIPSSRYFYPLVPAVAALASAGIVQLWERKKIWINVGVITMMVITGIQSLGYAVAPLQARYASDDRDYFVESELSALGLGEIVTYLKKGDFEKVVGVSGTWGVTDGSLAILNDAGITAVSIAGWSGDPGKIGLLTLDFPSRRKFVYLTGETEKWLVMKNIYHASLIQEFTRGGRSDGQKVYFGEINSQ